ncbi:hypothetical protein K491DRAFT_262156 [Lophiostoma macrostomum CBS 122681]|uniref:Uncharacterized protein n=1 Tax=Lophiostoma macrostomum CBS 122681 TaxID=1314788 RepID=A0A6A6SM36_9PLEO|nr:hypothetical protein K491DRAFT_262156 [Lophiostoma macrostomum CBS 122681]
MVEFSESTADLHARGFRIGNGREFPSHMHLPLYFGLERALYVRAFQVVILPAVENAVTVLSSPMHNAALKSVFHRHGNCRVTALFLTPTRWTQGIKQSFHANANLGAIGGLIWRWNRERRSRCIPAPRSITFVEEARTDDGSGGGFGQRHGPRRMNRLVSANKGFDFGKAVPECPNQQAKLLLDLSSCLVPRASSAFGLIRITVSLRLASLSIVIDSTFLLKSE